MVLLHPSFSFIPYQITKKKNKTKKKLYPACSREQLTSEQTVPVGCLMSCNSETSLEFGVSTDGAIFSTQADN